MNNNDRPREEEDRKQKIAGLIRELLRIERANSTAENPLEPGIESRAQRRLRMRQELVQLLALSTRRVWLRQRA